MPTTLITGANRGIGLEFVRQYAAAGWQVHATCRAPQKATALQALADRYHSQITLHALDVADFTAIDHLAARLAGSAIDLLLNNAGIYPDRASRGFGDIDYAAWEMAFRVNAMAPLRLAEAFVQHVAHSGQKKMAFLTSKMGSMGDNGSGGAYAYRSSKAALNAVAKSLAIDLAPHGISVAILHPGWVKTDMGGPNAWITPEQSVHGLRRQIERLDLASTGRFIDYDGKVVPW